MIASVLASVRDSAKDLANDVTDLQAVAMSSKMQTGTVTIAAEAGVVASQNITFDTPFNYAPAVMVSLNTNASAVLNGGNCAVSNVSPTGFTLNVFRPTAGNVPVRWVAFRP